MPHKVLVVDDSALMRRLLSQVLSGAGFEVALARTGTEGVERLQEFQPDVVTLDINMPEMDGLTALSLLMQARPTPVVMVSSLTTQGAQSTLEALALGAVDYIAKPGGTISLNLDDVASDLIRKVRAAAGARLRVARQAGERPRTASTPSPHAPAPSPRMGRASRPASFQVDPPRRSAPTVPPALSQAPRNPTLARNACGAVVIGVSTGGPRTLEDILPLIPADFPWVVLVAQHMPDKFTATFAQRMNAMCQLPVRECDGPVPLSPGQIIIAKGGADMVISERLGRLVALPVAESPEHPWHPSVDVLMDSALRRLPADQLVGVLLTGMGNDGAASMSRLKQRGGRTIAESRDSAVVFGMPQELIQLNGATQVLHSTQIAAQLNHWVQGMRLAQE